MSRASLISIGLGGALAAILLYLSIRGIDWSQVGSAVRHANPLYLAAVLILSTGALFIRSLRWRVLLTAAGDVSVATAFWATAAGYFGNNFLPARAGELVRTGIIASRARLDAAYVLATALSERAADAIALIAFAAVALVLLPARPGWTAAATRPFAVVAIVSVAILALLPRLERLASRVVDLVPVPMRVKSRLVSLIEQALGGIRSFHDPRRLSVFVALTVVIWSMDAIGAVLGAAALGFSMSLPLAFLLLAAMGLGSALPSTPGYVGIYQFVAVTVLTPFAFSRTDAIAYILVGQALSYVVIGVWGAIGLLRSRRPAAA